MKFGVCASLLNPEVVQTLAPSRGGNNFRRRAPHLHYNMKLKTFKKKTKNYLKAIKNIQNHRHGNKWRHPVSLQRCFFYAFVWGIVTTDILNTKIQEETYSPTGLKNQSSEFGVPTASARWGRKNLKEL